MVTNLTYNQLLDTIKDLHRLIIAIYKKHIAQNNTEREQFPLLLSPDNQKEVNKLTEQREELLYQYLFMSSWKEVDKLVNECYEHKMAYEADIMAGAGDTMIFYQFDILTRDFEFFVKYCINRYQEEKNQDLTIDQDLPICVKEFIDNQAKTKAKRIRRRK